MKKINNALSWFIRDGSLAARLARTLLEVIFSFFVGNAGDIFGLFNLSPSAKGLLTAFTIMVTTALLGFINDNKKPDVST